MADATRGFGPSVGARLGHQRILNCTVRDTDGGFFPARDFACTVSR